MADFLFIYPDYKLFDYEKLLSLKELKAFWACDKFEETDNGYLWFPQRELSDDDYEKIRRLTYFKHAQSHSEIIETKQALIERTCAVTGSKNRQTTRYGSHGLHEYKGKFNPQIVSCLLNLFQIEREHIVFDPFCGSGTTLLEAQRHGLNAVGTDVNPLAAYIANAKINSVKLNCNKVISALDNVVDVCRKDQRIECIEDERSVYLTKWFTAPILQKIENLRNVIATLPHEDIRNFLFCCASNILREYSLQEPADLRIRRRKTPLPDVAFIDAFIQEVTKQLRNIENAQESYSYKSSVKALNIDVKEKEKISTLKRFDAAITSPPYATALPYIDTQRLSLIWLGLATPTQVKELERGLIGSREATPKHLKELQSMIRSNKQNIPVKLHELCVQLMDALDENDGFRRQAVPSLIYRYFHHMHVMFKNVRSVMKKGAPFALVVGHNHTTLGGQRFDLDTPSYLVELAENTGWSLSENFTLNAYHRYNLHSKNSGKNENLLILTS